ncbi:hypothetical protein BJF78_00510 [Pseudonocardia sp. CNS-139]|nr:hypothetical protein BJF78_00510 [Pseudonocardia sp. CNS-139]
MLGSCLNPVNSSMIATALVPIGQELGAGPAEAAALVAVLYLASAVAQPTMGRLAQWCGPRRVFVAGAVLVLVGGVVGASAASLPVLLGARVLLGIGTSAAYPTAMLLIRRRADEHGVEPPGSVLGWLTIAAQTTSALGLPIGGLLVGLWGWRATLLVNIPVAVLCGLMAWSWVPRDPPGPARRRPLQIASELDVLGIALFSAAATALLLVLLPVQRPLPVVAALAVACFGAFVWWERRAREPFVDVRRLVANVGLSRTYLRTGLSYLLTYSVLFGFTQWLQAGRGLSAEQAGLVMLPMMVTSVLVAAAVSRRRLVRAPLLVAALVALAVAGVMRLGGATTPVVLIVVVVAVFGLTMGLVAVGNQAALYVQVSARGMGVAAGLLRTSIYLGAILSSAATGLVFGSAGLTDAGLHRLAELLAVLAAVLVLFTLLDRGLPRRMENERG